MKSRLHLTQDQLEIIDRFAVGLSSDTNENGINFIFDLFSHTRNSFIPSFVFRCSGSTLRRNSRMELDSVKSVQNDIKLALGLNKLS